MNDLRSGILLILAIWVMLSAVPQELYGDDRKPPVAARWKGIHLAREFPAKIEGSKERAEAHTGLLAREIIRQAVLMVAREEFGLITRDATLGDQEGSSDLLSLSIRSEVLVDGTVTCQITSEREDASFHCMIRAKCRGLAVGMDYADLSRVALESARKDFGDALKATGFAPKALNSSSAKVPDVVIEQMAHLSPLSQFSAVRTVHSAIARGEATAAHFAALSEAYTNLGVLCHPLWLSQTEVFLARGLLYADRLLECEPASSHGDWLKGYALAMMGCYPLARESIAAAEKKAGGGERSGRPWEGLLGPLADGDWQVIEAAVKKEKSGFEWGEWARWRSMGGDFWMGRRVAGVARAHVESNGPLCVPMTFQLFRSSSINDSHLAMRSFLPALAKETERHVPKLASLPDSLGNDVQEDPEGLASTSQKLLELSGKDRGEPSTGALALLMEDLVFSHSVFALRFMSRTWGVPWEGYFQLVEPLVRHHPYRPFLSLAGGLDTDDPTELAARYLNEPRLDRRFPMILATDRLYGMRENGRDLGQTIWYSIVSGRDDTGLDMVDYINGLGSDRDKLKYLKVYNKVCGQRPYSTASIIKFELAIPDVSNEVMADTVGRHPESAAILAKAFVHMQELEWAVRTYRQALDLDGEPTVFLDLAKLHQSQAETEKWRAVLEEMLQQPDQDLSHANARIQIAEYHIDRDQFKEAMPYAEKAAETFMAKGLICAYICADGGGLYTKAEEYLRALVDRYPGEAIHWYTWCQRSGKGDIKSAREAIAPILRSIRQRTDAESQRVLALIYEMEEESDQARQGWETAYLREPSAIDLACLLIDAYEQKDQERIKAWESRVAEGVRPNLPDEASAKEFTLLSQAVLADSKGEGNQVTPDQVKEWVKGLSLAESAALRCLAARYLAFRDRKDDALAVLAPAIQWRRSTSLWQTRAAKLARQIRGETHERENDDPKI